MKKYLLAFIPALLFVGAGCASSSLYATPVSQPTSPQVGAPTPAPASEPAPSPSIKKSVSISGFSFQPSTVTVKAGTTVIWTNQDPMAHTVTADDGSLDSGTLASNATYSHTFTQTGSFSYHCRVHPSMKATVVVQ